MEFTKDIYFNDSLKNGGLSQITYSGELFKSGSENVNIVFGFGENWDYTTTQPMQKTENGFTAEIEIKDYDTFNFCFSNEYNNWDNNNNFNYISPILQKVDETENDINYGTDYSDSIDDIIENILGNTVQNNIANDKDSDSVDKILESITEETLPEIEDLFTELFTAEFSDPQSSKEIQEEKIEDNIVSSISEKSNAELIKLFDELFESALEPTPISFVETAVAEEKNEKSTVQEAITEPIIIGDSIVESVIEEKQEDKLNVNQFNLDNLVSELLEPVIEKAVVTDTNNNCETSLFDDIKNHGETIEEESETSLTLIDSKDLLVSSRRLGSFYKFKKRIKLAFYKLFIKIPKELIKQLNFGNFDEF